MRTPAILACAVLLAACSDTDPAAPDPESTETYPVFWLQDLSEVDGAGARLTRNEGGVSFSLETKGLAPGDVVTVWWLIFNDPDGCENPFPPFGSTCDLPDLFVDVPVDLTPNPEVNPAVMLATADFVGDGGDMEFSGNLSVGQITSEHPLLPDGPGLVNATGAEIHLIVRTQGPPVQGRVEEMLSTYEGGCTPESSWGFGDGPNTCADLQVTVFRSP